jgi:hypothetical protein
VEAAIPLVALAKEMGLAEAEAEDEEEEAADRELAKIIQIKDGNVFFLNFIVITWSRT